MSNPLNVTYTSQRASTISLTELHICYCGCHNFGLITYMIYSAIGFLVTFADRKQASSGTIGISCQ
eukprot:scaffold382463_cov15-Prasinocladus_malaysianus.AAC.1